MENNTNNEDLKFNEPFLEKKEVTAISYDSSVVDEIVENEPQITKIVTPVDDWTYWAKWIGNAFLIVGTLLTNLALLPMNYIFNLIGLFLWAIVAAQWNDRSLVVLNVFLLGTVAMTLAQHIKEYFL